MIKLGAIATKQPGTDFTDIPNMAKAYFDCVNNNGGIRGRRIQYTIETEQTNPGQNAALVRKLVASTKVVGAGRQHEHHRVRHQPRLLREQGHLHDRLGDRP